MNKYTTDRRAVRSYTPATGNDYTDDWLACVTDLKSDWMES